MSKQEKIDDFQKFLRSRIDDDFKKVATKAQSHDETMDRMQKEIVEYGVGLGLSISEIIELSVELNDETMLRQNQIMRFLRNEITTERNKIKTKERKVSFIYDLINEVKERWSVSTLELSGIIQFPDDDSKFVKEYIWDWLQTIDIDEL